MLVCAARFIDSFLVRSFTGFDNYFARRDKPRNSALSTFNTENNRHRVFLLLGNDVRRNGLLEFSAELYQCGSCFYGVFAVDSGV